MQNSFSEETRGAINLFTIIHTCQDTNILSRTIKQIEEWEQSDGAWKVCTEILQSDLSTLVPEEVLFFANVLHKKVRRDYAQLPMGGPSELRKIILGAILGLHRTSAITTTTTTTSITSSNNRHRKSISLLGACIAALSIHMHGARAWPDPVSDIIASFCDVKAPGCALGALAKMPEEAAAQELRVGRAQRDGFCVYLSNAVEKVFAFLTEVLKASGADIAVQTEAFQCIYAWFKYCTFTYDSLKASPIIPALFLGLSHPALFDVAVDAITESITVAGSLSGSTSEGEDPLRDYFIDSVISMAPRYAESVAQNNLWWSIGYSRICSDVGCSYASYLVRCSAPRCLRFTEIAVEIARNPEHEVHLLVLTYFDELAAAINASLPEQRLLLAAPFVPHIQRLTGHLIAHLVLPPSSPGEDDGEDEDVARYRKYDIGQCISAYSVLGSPTGVLEVIVRALTEALPLLESDWRPAEAALYALRCVAPRVTPPTPEAAAFLGPFRDGAAATLLGHAGCAVVALRRTALGAVGAYAAYFRGAPCLPRLLEGIAGALGCGVPVLQSAAAAAFASVCDACAADLCPYAEGFKTLYARSLGLTGTPAQDVARGLCAVINAMPPAQGAALLDAYCAATAAELQRIVAAAAAAQQGAVSGEKERTAVLDALGRLKVFLKCVDDDARIVACLEKVFPVAEALVAGAQALCSPEVVGAMVALYDVALSRPGVSSSSPVVQSMFRAPVAHYVTQPSALDLAFVNGILARMKVASDAAANPAVRTALAEVLATVAAATAKFLSAGGGRAAVLEAPDVVEGFFAFVDTFTTRLPALVAQGSVLQDTVTLALAVLSLTQQPGATRAVCIFLSSVLRVAHSAQVLRPAVDACLGRLGQQIVHAVLCGVAGAQPRDFVHNASAVMFQFRAYARDAFFAIVAACLEIQNQVPQAQQIQGCCGRFPVNLELETRLAFYTKLKKAVSSRNVETVLDEFGFSCRSVSVASV